MNPTFRIPKMLVVVLVGVALFIGGYFWGRSKGYKAAEADVKKVQAEAAQKASDEAAKAANPFQVVNPLAGVEANPFEKAKKVLNPFK